MVEDNRNLQKYQKELNSAVEYVSMYWTLNKFKQFISQFLLTENNEDQWTFDYESYVMTVYREGKKPHELHPMHWAPEYYQERWNNKK